MESHEAIAKLSDEALDAALGKLHRSTRDQTIALGRATKRGRIVAVSDDLPPDTVIVTKAELLWERAQRRKRKA